MIYLHIPFCKQKCSYCNFHFSTSLRDKEPLLLALKNEIQLRHGELKQNSLKSIYFGGGTPSLLKIDEIKSLLGTLLKYYNFDQNIEITIEANPDDLDSSFLKALSTTEINRLSIGTQSFHEPDLKLMNRAHNATEAEDSIKRAQDFGFQNLSLDLIYGAPTADLEIWRQNLQKAILLEVPHISSYALTVEPQTALHQWVLSQKVPDPSESLQNQEFYLMSQFLKENGFEHYEISNFAKPGFQSKHNAAYWQGKEYLGFGPSAHSFDGDKKRSWNVANNQKYIKSLLENKLILESEILTEKEQFNELIMIGLRTKLGVNFVELHQNFPSEILGLAKTAIEDKLDQKLLILDGNFLKIPEKHWFLADGIASDLFLL